MNWHYKYSPLLLIIITYLSLKNIDMEPMRTLPFAIPHADKIIHLIMYLVLGGTCTMESQHITNKYAKVSFCIIAPILYSGIIELLQEYYFPPRTGEWADIACNTIGVLIGWNIANYWIKHIRRNV